MDFKQYEKQFDEILNDNSPISPYDSDDYLHYVKLNKSRVKRWYKIGEIIPELHQTITKINHPQHWVLITEPWCGDAANSHAIISKIVDLNPNIKITIQNRDAKNSEIDHYLTNGGKSIPKLIIRNNNNEDLFTWGPRPKEAQKIANKQKENIDLTLDEKIIEIQNWYNKDKSISMQLELNELFKNHI